MTIQEKISKIKSYKLLFVEDEVDLINIISTTLSKLQITYFMASDGLEGLELFRSNPDIDVIVTDINMPVMDGVELIKEIRKINQTVKIIIMSAHSEEEFLEEAKQIGANDYLVKPFDFMKFINIVANIE